MIGCLAICNILAWQKKTNELWQVELKVLPGSSAQLGRLRKIFKKQPAAPHIGSFDEFYNCLKFT